MCNDYKLNNFLEPWYYIKSNGGLEKELYREVGPRHILHCSKLVAIARRDDCDDVLFSFVDKPSMLAVVHLTWSGKQECDTNWPVTKIYKNWNTWVNERIIPDNTLYEQENN